MKILYNLLRTNFDASLNPNAISFIYFFIFIILLLENGLIFASFLPGDSLLVLIGILSEKKILNFSFVLFLLTIASSLGSWISYMQGRWIKNNRITKKWINYFPSYYTKTYKIFNKYGLFSLFIGRFIAFIRTILPIIVALSGLSNIKFFIFNGISSFFWVFILTLLGFFIGKLNLVSFYKERLTIYILLFSIILLLVILIIFFFIFLYRRYLR